MMLYELFTEFWPHITFVLASIVGFLRWRAGELRHSEVMEWANECIRVARGLLLKMQQMKESKSDHGAEILALSDQASILIEQGRLLFRNVRSGDAKNYGLEKPLAYQGFRPKILDWMLCIHDAGLRWNGARPDDRERLLRATERAAQEFVSLAQQEVGRARTASKATKEAGGGSPLDRLLADISNKG